MKTIIYVVVLLLGSMACATSSSQSQESADASTVADTTKYPSNLEADSFPNGEPVHESGVLRIVQDSGYPFFTLEIEFPELNTTEVYSLNMEEIEGLNPKKAQ
ncbi:MAG: hypothetical protein IPQ23_17135 [Cytophagaceae bacterium]|nr:hypothetical protein [Cytophagaceae bacterium]